MIPPTPGPDPPLPDVPEYTYSSSEPITLGSVTGTLYKDIQRNGNTCELTATSGANTFKYKHLILYEVDGTHYCYFANRSSTPIIAILGNNAEIGLTVTTYLINNGSVTQDSSQYLDSSTPDDYFENVRTGNFTLLQRS